MRKLQPQLPNEAVYEFGDRTCETLRRGGSLHQIEAVIHSQFSREDERMTYLKIARVAQETLCPERHWPAVGWRRSLFFWKERLNGGHPL